MSWAAPAASTRATDRPSASRSGHRRCAAGVPGVDDSCRAAAGDRTQLFRLRVGRRHAGSIQLRCRLRADLAADAGAGLGRPHGDWTIIERSPGVRQWAFRGKPLYRYALDSHARSLEGSDVPGWHNVYTQRAPAPPAEFTVQDTSAGQVLADAHGMTIYVYTCGDDALDQLGCDHPSETQVYRLAMCGGGDWQRCLRTFPYVIAAPGAPQRAAAPGARSTSTRKTGRRAAPGQDRCRACWAYAIGPSTCSPATTSPAMSTATVTASSAASARATKLSGCATITLGEADECAEANPVGHDSGADRLVRRRGCASLPRPRAARSPMR